MLSMLRNNLFFQFIFSGKCWCAWKSFLVLFEMTAQLRHNKQRTEGHQNVCIRCFDLDSVFRNWACRKQKDVLWYVVEDVANITRYKTISCYDQMTSKLAKLAND